MDENSILNNRDFDSIETSMMKKILMDKEKRMQSILKKRKRREDDESEKRDEFTHPNKKTNDRCIQRCSPWWTWVRTFNVKISIDTHRC